MIQTETNLVVADNSGARSVRVFRLKGGSNRKSCSIGDVVTCAVKVAIPNGRVKKSDIVKGVIVRTKHAINRPDGSTIAFDDNAGALHAGGCGAVVHGNNGAGDGGVNRNAQPLRIADLLTEGYTVSDLDQRGTGPSDMLRHRNADLLRTKRHNGRFFGQFLIALRVNAAKKESSHNPHHLNSYLYIFTIAYRRIKIQIFNYYFLFFSGKIPDRQHCPVFS